MAVPHPPVGARSFLGPFRLVAAGVGRLGIPHGLRGNLVLTSVSLFVPPDVRVRPRGPFCPPLGPLRRGTCVSVYYPGGWSGFRPSPRGTGDSLCEGGASSAFPFALLCSGRIANGVARSEQRGALFS